MKIQAICTLKNKILLGTLLTISSILTTTSNAEAFTLRVSIENLAPENGQGIAPVWFGLHDGSFDLLDNGSPASTAIEFVAEDGISGNPQGRIPPDFVAEFVANGADLSLFPPENTLSFSFATSQAGLNGGYQDLLFFDRRVDPYFGGQLAGETTSTTFTLTGDVTNNLLMPISQLMVIK